MIADVPRARLYELASRVGDGLGEDAARCEALLIDACGDGFDEECAALVAAIEQGVTADLLRSRQGSETPGALLDRLCARLEADPGLSAFWARWSVECWALALRVVPESDRLMVVRLGGLAPLGARMGTNGTFDSDDLDSLVAEARARGIGDAEARAFLSHFAARYGARPPGVVAAQPEAVSCTAEPAMRMVPCVVPIAPASPSGLTIPVESSGPGPSPAFPWRRRSGWLIFCALDLLLLFAALLIVVEHRRMQGHSEVSTTAQPQTTQPDRQRIEAERQQQLEAERRRQQEAERQRQLDAERQREAAERERQAEAERQNQLEAERQREAEAERQRQAEAERQRQQALASKPDLQGIVTGAQSSARLILDKQVIELFGIVDPTVNLRPHIEAVLKYLAPSRRQVECFTRPGGKFQCFADGQDLALLALHDGIAQLGPDAPIEYRGR